MKESGVRGQESEVGRQRSEVGSAPTSDLRPLTSLPCSLTPDTWLLAPEPVQETDAWWGSYSGWTMMPSMVVCLGLTAFIAWASWRLLERGWVQLGVLTLAGALWLVQAFRWCYRVFGYNYRVTTRRVFQTKGILYDRVEVNLADVTKVEVRRGPHDQLAGVGEVCLTLEDPTLAKPGARVILEGVSHPGQVADHIRRLSEQAREQQVTAAKFQDSFSGAPSPADSSP